MANLINELHFEVKLAPKKLKSFMNICVFLAKIGKELIIGNAVDIDTFYAIFKRFLQKLRMVS